MSGSPKRLAWLSAIAVVASGLLLPPAPAQAAGPGLVINEVYGGGGNNGSVLSNDFIELKNTSSAPISLAGKSIQYRGAGTTTDPTSGNIFVLPEASVAPGRTFLVAAAAGTQSTGPLPTPDATSTLALGGSGGQVVLANQTTPVSGLGTGAINHPAVIDFVGWGATTTSYEGSGAAPATTNATSTARNAAGADTDNNAADLTTGAPTPTNSTSGGGDPQPTELTATDPGARTGMVGSPIAAFTLAASGGTAPYTWAVTGLPAGLSATSAGAISGTPSEAGTFEAAATVTDNAGATATVNFTLTIAPAPDLKTIAEVQGTGERSPYAPASGNGAGDMVTVEGVVTARYATGGLNGMYIQDPGPDTPDASDGVFVYAGSSNANIPAGVAIGDSVRVTGAVTEFNGLTQIAPASADAVAVLADSLGTVEAREIGFPATDAEREVREGELILPSDEHYTVTNTYSANTYAEIGLAVGERPLRQPTEYVSPQDSAGIAAIKADNAARSVALDDGSSVNYMTNSAAKNQPLPWLTPTNAIRVGAEVTFTGPVVLEWRNSVWKFQPTEQVTDDGADIATFEDTRADNLVPRNVGGDLKIATFNVLNYFNTTGEEYVANGPKQNPPVDTHCTWYTDRQGNRIGNDQCGTRGPGIDPPNDGRGPRGAATAASLARQEAKLRHTLEAMNADVVGLEEVENSIKLPGEPNRDDAVARIVELLNDAAGERKWAYVKSPGEALTAAAIAEQDVIRQAFIYRVDRVEPVGASAILFGTTEFANAREPLAQAFKAKGAPDRDAFAVIVNHFKSKGDNASPAPPATGDNANDTETGVGAFNGDRVRQARRLAQFAQEFAEDRDLEAVFLAGDFNSYTKEQPISVLEEAGFELVESNDPADETYSYSGLSGSLDHVLGNAAAMEMVTGADIWQINAEESVAFQYSRYNYNLTDFWQPNLPFATSDHNPEIVGIDVPDFESTPTRKIQVLGTNDFHGRLLPDAGNAAGAAPFASAVKELTAENPNSVFAAAGDLVGASTFESFIQDDEPTIDALNAMGLEVSAAGNHEFDRGFADLTGRIRDLADWEYLAANLEYDETVAEEDQLAQTWTKTIDGVEVGFVGAVTEDLPALVNPAGIEQLTVTDVVEATNAAAAQLREDGADLVVLLVHEGAPTTQCRSEAFTDPATTWGNIVQNTSADVDAIISGHTHLAYNCRFPVAGWEGRAVTKRPVVSAGQYGTNLNRLVFEYDEDQLVGITQDVVAAAGVGYPADAEVQEIVDAAVAFADTKGAEVLGSMEGAFQRASYLASGKATENRGGESTLSNKVAEVQRWATDRAGIETDLAFMNPGGLRADMVGTANGDRRDLTYRQAADVQPFANTLVTMDLTGAQIETVLEQQWQRNANGGVPSRPFLRLGVSEGFTYTYVETPETVQAPNSAPVQTFRGEVTGMWLDGEPIDAEQTYRVTVNSFLGSGGDNFWELANGTGKVDSGQVDLQAMVDYMAQYDADAPLPVDYAQRAVEVTFPQDAPQAYGPGDEVRFDVASWSMTAEGDATDEQLQVKLGGEVIGTAAVTTAASTTPYDRAGTASVRVTLPEGVRSGVRTLQLVGPATGTTIPVEITVEDGLETIQILATNDFHGRIQRSASSAEAGAAVLAGAVKQLRSENPNTVFAAAGDLIGASTFESFIQNDKPTIDALNEAGLEVSAVGNHELDQGYEDLMERVLAEYDAEDNPQGGAEWEYIAANLKLKATGDPAVPATWIKTMSGVDVGFVGAVTEDLPTLVSPSGITELRVDPIVSSVNAAADDLVDEGADVVVMLVHEGAPSTSCARMTDTETAWGRIVTGVNDNVDAIVSGHTHLAYDCAFPVPGWEGRAVTERPVVSAGQYGANLNQLEFQVDPESGEVVDLDTELIALQSCTNCPASSQVWEPNFTADPAVTTLVADAVRQADVLGARTLGKIGGAFSRAKLANGTENRGGESTLGNLVAEVQRWATGNPESGSAQIAFMNPGGLRQDMVGEGTGDYPRALTYKQAAVVQPFANTLVNMDLTGAQIKTVLEQQWQRDANNKVPSRFFLRLGVSQGFTYTYTQRTVQETPTDGSPAYEAVRGEVTGMWLHGEPIDLEATYSVTVNSFLASGGDNFRELANGTDPQDTGKVDLQAMVDYLDAFAAVEPLPVDYSQRAVRVSFAADAPDAYAPGASVAFDVASWSLSAAGDIKDEAISVRLGGEDGDELGTAALDNTVFANADDETGTARVSVTLPPATPAGVTELTLVGPETGTVVRVPITVETAEPVPSGVSVGRQELTYGQAKVVTVRVTGGGSGTVEIRRGARVLGTGLVAAGVARVTLPARSLKPGRYDLTAAYSGDTGVRPSSTTFAVKIAKARSTTSVTARPAKVKVAGARVTLRIKVAGQYAVPATGRVRVAVPGQGVRTVRLAQGRATVRLAKFATTGVKRIKVSYRGSGVLKASSDQVAVRVTRR